MTSAERPLPEPPSDPRRIDRRRFIVGGLAFGAGTLVVPKIVRGLVIPGARVVSLNKPTLTRWVRRREDFVHLYFEFYNLKLNSTGTKLVRISTTQAAFVVVTFPPQALLERSFKIVGDPPNEKIATETPLDTKTEIVPTRIGGTTRLAFTLDQGAEVPFTSEGLLAWDPFTHTLNPPPAGRIDADNTRPPLAPPGLKETAIEVPFWLVISPSEVSRWEHRTRPVTAPSGRTEAWHTQLAFSHQAAPDPLDDGRPQLPADERLVRAVWARDPNFGKYVCALETGPRDAQLPGLGNGPFGPTSLSPQDRAGIVLNSGHWREAGFRPEPFSVETLSLSTLGASIDASGDWWEPKRRGTSLRSWVHRGTLGRDQYVRTEEEGHLLPFGHRAVKLTITERTPHRIPSVPERPGAYLLTRTYYIVLEQEKIYPPPNQPAGLQQPFGARAFPFTRVRCVTRTTPALLDAKFGQYASDDASVPSWDAETPFPFRFIGIDRTGRNVGFEAPVGFLAAHLARRLPDAKAAAQTYSTVAGTWRPDDGVPLGGQRLALADPGPTGDTTIEAGAIHLIAQHEGHVAARGDPAEVETQLLERGLPAFWPAMEGIDAQLPAVQKAVSEGHGSVRLEYDGSYLQHGFADPSQIFAKLPEPAEIGFSADGRAGALVDPRYSIERLSRTYGAVADISTVSPSSGFDPAAYFSAADAMILGGIKLKDVIRGGDVGLGQVPTLRQRTTATQLISELRWTPQLKESGIFKLGDQPSLEVLATYATELEDPGSSTSTVIGDLRNVAISFPEGAELFTVHLNRLRFSSANGGKPDLRVDVGSVEFAGQLKLVDKLRDFLGPLLKAAGEQAGGPAIEANTSGITSTYTLPVPAVEVGVFLLQNLTVSAGLNIPFGAKPARATYSFSSRDNPFLLTVSALGGGGYITVRAGIDEIEFVEGSLDFGGSTKISLAVAKGSLHALAGITYSLDKNGDMQLGGFFRMGGSLRVIGLVTVSAEFYMKLQWVESSGKVVGSAAIEVEVDCGLFSKSVTVGPVERKFGGHGADPSFAALYAPDDWNEYCLAFAEEPIS